MYLPPDIIGEIISGHKPYFLSTLTLTEGEESGTGLFPGHSGLSVSHDSVFTAEQRSSHSSCEDLDIGQSSSSLSIQQLVLPGVRK
uniref:Uncharacterized protein n=1 Tax=Timema monikensis TaxID=170555 RepID=A0A7R9HS44_9NEOP|nr:unnamed protein product [Timema monikensis]